MSVNFDDLQWCCGIAVVGDFGATSQTSGSRNIPYSKEELKKELKKVEKINYTSSMMIATLNDDQYEAYIKVFKELGWSVVRKGINGLHGSTNYLLVKVLRKQKK